MHFPPGLQPVENKETTLAQCPPFIPIFQAFSVYFLEVQVFMKLNYN